MRRGNAPSAHCPGKILSRSPPPHGSLPDFSIPGSGELHLFQALRLFSLHAYRQQDKMPQRLYPLFLLWRSGYQERPPCLQISLQLSFLPYRPDISSQNPPFVCMRSQELITTPLSPPSQGGDFVVSAQSNDEVAVFHRLFTILVMATKTAPIK